MSAQLDLFGGELAHKSRKAPRKSAYPTCWDDCLLCGKVPLSYKGRVFRACTHPGSEAVRCYEGDVICQKASLPRQVEDPSMLKFTSPGWADY